MTSFSSILDKRPSEVDRPKPLPVGTYLWLVKGQPRMDKSAQKKTDFVEFTLEALQPSDDVDQEALSRMGGCVGKSQRITFYITEDAVWRLQNKEGNGFLDQLGIDDGTLRERIAAAPGCQVYGTIRHKPSQDGTQIYAEIAQTAKV